MFPFLGFDHWAVLILTAAAGFVLLVNAKRIRCVSDDRVLRYGLAAGLIINEVAAFFFFLHLGTLKIPLQLCDLAIFFMAVALISHSHVVEEVAFFWGLAGSSQAMFTPDLAQGFPSFQFCQFFLGHCAVILSAVYLAVRGRVRLGVSSVWKAWIVTNLYAGVAGLINWRFGLNLGYLAAKPRVPTVLNFFGPWPYYIIGMEFLAIGLFFLCSGFARLIDRFAGGPSNKI